MTSGVAHMEVQPDAPTLPDPPGDGWTPKQIAVADLFLVGEYKFFAGFKASRTAQLLRKRGFDASSRKGWVHVVLSGGAV